LESKADYSKTGIIIAPQVYNLRIGEMVMEYKHLSKSAALKRLNATESRIKQLCENGKLHPRTLNSGKLVFKREEIETLVRQLSKVQARQIQKTEGMALSLPKKNRSAKPKPQLLMFLEDSTKTRNMLHTFEQFLKSYDLKIIDCLQHETEKLIEIIIDAYNINQVNCVSSLAYDFLGNSVISIRTRY
jgi:hypothetical protein